MSKSALAGEAETAGKQMDSSNHYKANILQAFCWLMDFNSSEAFWSRETGFKNQSQEF